MHRIEHPGSGRDFFCVAGARGTRIYEKKAGLIGANESGVMLF
jgi:hypothetical protein